VDWTTASALATAAGTLVLAGTTYASVRSANRAARMAEKSLLIGMRPLLIQSSPADPPLRAGFFDGVTVTAPGEGAGVEVIDGRVYIAVSLRNVGPGIAVLHGGCVFPERRSASEDHAPLDDFRLLSRDIYIPPGKIGFWQIAFRDDDQGRDEVRAAVDRGRISVQVLYGDYEGGQRVISQFGVIREDDGWSLAVNRHWQVDRADPRRDG
jgi:hypothetical protein